MPKTNIPSYRLHKASGQAFVELGGRRFYLGKPFTAFYHFRLKLLFSALSKKTTQ